MKSRAHLYKLFLFRSLYIFIAFILLLIGSLFYPGWNLRPLLNYVEEKVPEFIPGTEAKVEYCNIKITTSLTLCVEIRGVRFGEAGAEPFVVIGNGYAGIPLKRLITLKMVPDRITVRDCDVVFHTDAQGHLVFPAWLLESSKAEATPEMDTAAPLRLANLPSFIYPGLEDTMLIEFQDYRAHLQQPDKRFDLRMPDWALLATGTETGMRFTWKTDGWEMAGAKFIEGWAEANRHNEIISWENRVNLPLTPPVAGFMKSAFPFLPIPPSFDTGTRLEVGGQYELIPGKLSMDGSFTVFPGKVEWDVQDGLIFNIPRIQTEFSNLLEIVDDKPVLTSNVNTVFQFPRQPSVFSFHGAVDQSADKIGVQSTGNLANLAPFFDLLPEIWRPVHIEGNLEWDAAMATPYSTPDAVKSGTIGFRSSGMILHWKDSSIPPLHIGPFQFQAEMAETGRLISVAPFLFQAGPITLKGSGLEYDAAKAESPVQTEFSLMPVTVTELLQQLPSELLQLEPSLRSFVETIAVNVASLGIILEPAPSASIPVKNITLKPQLNVKIGKGAFGGSGQISLNPQTRDLRASLVLDPLNPSHWQLPEADEWLQNTADFSLSLVASGNAGDRSTDLQMRISSDGGRLIPGPRLAEFLKEPIPLDNFNYELAIHGRDRFDCRLSTDLSIGEASFAFDSELSGIDPENPDNPFELIYQLELASIRPAQFLAYLHEDFRKQIPLAEDEINDFALNSTHLTTAVTIENATSELVAHNASVQLSNNIQVGMKELLFELSTIDSPNPEIRILSGHLKPINPSGFNLRLEERLPVQFAVFDFPISGGIEVSIPAVLNASQFENLADIMKMKLHGNLGRGAIKPNIFLESPVPINDVTFDAILYPLKQYISDFSLIASLDNPVFTVTGSELTLDPILEGQISLSADNLPFAWLLDKMPRGQIPAEFQQDFESLKLDGGIQFTRIHATLGEPPAQSQIPFLAAFSMESQIDSVRLLQSRIPPIHMQRLRINGNEKHLAVQIDNAGHASFTLNSLLLEIENPVVPFPKLRMRSEYQGDFSTLHDHLPYLPDSVTLPSWLRAEDIRGAMTGILTLQGTVHPVPLPEHWQVTMENTLQNLYTPHPVEGFDYSHVDHSNRLLWDGHKITIDWNLTPANLQFSGLLKGNPVVSGQIQATPSGIVDGTVHVDLVDFATELDLLAVNKPLGSPADIKISFTGDAGLSDLPPSFSSDVKISRLLFPHLDFATTLTMYPQFQGDFGGLKSLHINFSGMDHSDIELQANVSPDAVIDLKLNSQTLNLGPAISQLEPMIMDLLAPSPDIEQPVPSKAEIAPEAPTPPVPADSPGLPEVHFDLAFNNIQFGNVDRLGPVSIKGSLAKNTLDNLQISMAHDRQTLQADVQPRESIQRFEIGIQNLSGWLHTAIAPLHLLQTERARSSESLLALKDLPRHFSDGNLTLQGVYSINPHYRLDDAQFSLKGLALQTPFPFLDKIAALVDRSVLLQVPFKEFRFEHAEADQNAIQVTGLYMDGPINLDVESIDVQLLDQSLFLRGKVFGICFEVAGPLDDPKFYLCEDNTVIQSITTEDEFEW